MLNPTAIKSFLGDSSIETSVIERIEKMAIGYINSHLWYKIQLADYILEADGIAWHIYTPQYPIRAIEKIEVNYGTVFDENFSDYDAEDYRAVWTAGKIVTRTHISRPVKISYSSGFISYVEADWETPAVETDLPDDLQTAILLLCKAYYDEETQEAKLKSETVDGDRVEFFNMSDRYEKVNDLLDSYMRYDVQA